MAKDIVIINNGVSETWQQIEKLRTKAYDGGYVEWQPEDETQTGTITINVNGTYTAADDGLYGYSRAIVNVPGMVKGTKDGVEYIITLDEEGNIVETPAEG